MSDRQLRQQRDEIRARNEQKRIAQMQEAQRLAELRNRRHGR